MTTRGKVILLILIGGLVMAVLFGGLLAYSFYFSSPTVAKNSVLELRLEGELSESAPVDASLRMFGGSKNTLKSVLDNIRRAKDDNNISGLMLAVNSLEIRHGKVEEIRDAIADFKKSGKPVFAYMERTGDLEYYLATSADKIYVSPVGDVNIKGFAAQATFYLGLFNKLKIEPNIERHGKYKSFGDSYTRDSMSPDHRESIEAILDSLYTHYVAAIAESRKKDPEEVKQLIDNGPYANAEEATKAGLIDGALYIDEVKEQFKQQLKLGEYEGVASSKYSDADGGFGADGEKIAIIYATGGINSGKSNNSPFGGETLGSDTIAGAIKKAREDSSIKAIILRVDSPGGSALASDIIWREVNLAKKQKPFIASMSDLAASGGYYISMAADKIVAQPGTLTGSIGVVTGKMNMNGLYHEHFGLTIETVKRGRNADFYSDTRNFTEEERTKAHQDMMNFYNAFVAKAAEGRKMSAEALDAVAQGRVWTGEQAKNNGLVDELGGLPKAIEIAKELAKLPANETPRLVEYPKSPTLFEAFFGGGDDVSDTREASERAAVDRYLSESMPADLRSKMRALAVLKQFENERVLAVMPYFIAIK